MEKEIAIIIDRAIDAGKVNDPEIYSYFQSLDESIGTDVYSNNLRNFFDSWSDAIGHDYLPYKEKDVEVWISAAQDIKGHYLSQTPLRLRRLWQECAVKHT